MKSIITYIVALFLASTFAYGSQYLDHESGVQEIQIYQESPWHTPEEWKKIPSLDYPWITAEEEKIATERAMRRFYKVGTWRSLHDHIILHNDAWHSGCKTPSTSPIYFYTQSELQEQSQQLMKNAQHYLENINKKIDQNIKDTTNKIKYRLKKDRYHHHDSEDYFDPQEYKRRLKKFDTNYHNMELRSKTENDINS